LDTTPAISPSAKTSLTFSESIPSLIAGPSLEGVAFCGGRAILFFSF